MVILYTREPCRAATHELGDAAHRGRPQQEAGANCRAVSPMPSSTNVTVSRKPASPQAASRGVGELYTSC